jgi:ribosomal protein S27AE
MNDDEKERLTARNRTCPRCHEEGVVCTGTGILSNQPYAPDMESMDFRCPRCEHTWFDAIGSARC